MGIKTLRPPHYAADKSGHFIYRGDSSIDWERYERELAEMGAAAEQLLQEKPGADIRHLTPSEHPLERYWAGAHRFDLDAVDYHLGKPVTIRDYFSKGEPTIFVFKRLSSDEYTTCMAMRMQAYRVRPDRPEPDEVKIHLAANRACRFGLADIIGGPYKLTRDSDGGVSEDIMVKLQEENQYLPVGLGNAILLGYCQPLTSVEKKV